MSQLTKILQKQYEVVSAYQEVALKDKDKEAAHSLAAVIDKIATLSMVDDKPITD